MKQIYSILYTISLFHPKCRMGIVTQTGFPERFVRKEVDFLQQQGLIFATTKGVEITEEGKSIISDLHQFVRELMGLTTLEHRLEDLLLVDKVIVVGGNSRSEEQHV